MTCKNCGADIHDASVQCPFCGTSTGVQLQKPNDAYQNGYPQNNYSQNNYSQNQYGSPQNQPYPPVDQVNAGLVILAILIPLAGLIVGAVNMSNGKKRSGKVYLITAIVTWILSIIASVVLNMLAIIVGSSSY